jgi:hypothetical protein
MPSCVIFAWCCPGEFGRAPVRPKQFRHFRPELLHGLVKRCVARDGLASWSSGADDLGV